MRSAGPFVVRGSVAGDFEGRSRGARDRVFFGASALLFVASAVGTIGWCGSMSDGMAMPGGWNMSMAWMRMPGQSWPGAAASFLGMWVVMMVAMMMQSLIPKLSNDRRTVRRTDETWLGALTAVAGTGYFFVWTVIGAAAYPLGLGLAAAEMRWPALAHLVPLATGAVLLLAGCVQLSAWKARQLGNCRNGPACGRSLSTDFRSAWRHGLRLGLHCTLCCSGFVMILLTAGVMDLRVMALIAAAITLERLAPSPERVARATGVAVVAAAALVIARALIRP